MHRLEAPGVVRPAGQISDELRLRRACQSMESAFFQILLKEMWRPSGSGAASMYQTMHVEHLANHLVAAGGIGLSDTLYQHLAGTLSVSRSEHTLTVADANGQESNQE